MGAGTYNFTLEQGSAFTLVITYKDANKNVVPLTGYSARMQIRKTSGELLLELSSTNGKITLGGDAGTILLKIPATDTTALDFTVANYDLEIIPPSGEADAKRLLQGNVTFSKEVTK